MPYKDPDQRRAYQREWQARRRAEWFEGKTCIDCGTTENLQLDHVDPKEKITHRVWSMSKVRFDEEIAKCVVRCYKHHKKKTVQNNEHAQGEQIASSRLTEKDVRSIRQLFAEGYSKRGLARQFGVDEKAIRLLLAGETWKHVD